MLVILAEESVIALVVALHGRWMRAVPAFDNRVHEETGNNGAVGIAGDHLGLDYFFGNHDHALCGADSLNHDTVISPTMRVAFGV